MAIKKPHTALSQIGIPMQKCLLRSSLHSASFAKLSTLHSVPHYEVIIAGRGERSPTSNSLLINSESISSFPSFKIQNSAFKISYSLLPTPYSLLLPARYSSLVTRYSSLLSCLHYLLTDHRNFTLEANLHKAYYRTDFVILTNL